MKTIDTTLISMKDLSLKQRRDILLDLQIMKNKEVREKYNISANTITHIRFIHGKSNAASIGYYHKDLLFGMNNPIIDNIKRLKAQGKNSLEVAQELNLSLITVNKHWA